MRGDSVREEERNCLNDTAGEAFTLNPSRYLTFLLLLLSKRIVLLLYYRSLWVCDRLHCRVLVCVCMCVCVWWGEGVKAYMGRWRKRIV